MKDEETYPHDRRKKKKYKKRYKAGGHLRTVKKKKSE